MNTDATGNDIPAKIVEGIPSGITLEIVPKHEDRESDLLGAGAPETLRHIQDDVRDSSEQVLDPNVDPAIER